jgi:hypothetical protein
LYICRLCTIAQLPCHLCCHRMQAALHLLEQLDELYEQKHEKDPADAICPVYYFAVSTVLPTPAGRAAATGAAGRAL